MATPACSVTLCAELVVLIAWLAKFNDVGVTLTWYPVPLSATGLFVMVTPAVVVLIVTVPFTVPTAVGWNVTPIVQVPPAARFAPQPPAGRAKAPFEKLTLMPLNATLDCNVRV